MCDNNGGLIVICRRFNYNFTNKLREENNRNYFVKICLLRAPRICWSFQNQKSGQGKARV